MRKKRLGMHLRFTPSLVVMVSVLLAVQAVAQSIEETHRAPDWSPTALANLSLDPVGPGDLIGIYVGDYPEINRSYRLSGAGTVELPVLRRALSVNHMTTGEMEKTIAQALVDGGLLVNPVVSVSVLEYRSKPVTVVGAVRQPLTLEAIGGLRLLDAIAKANGLAPEAGPEIIVTRPVVDGIEGYERHIPVKELMSSSNSATNLSLQGGEEIRVPASEKLYIVGNVKNPGAYSLDQNGSLTVLQAIALCQGTLGFSQPVAVVYRTDPGQAGRREIDVRLRQILKRRVPDFELKANDILYIPEKSGQRLTASVIDRIANFGAVTGSGLIIWGTR